ncbi:NAC domain-containing protein [Melia azedarach]|uniref:NAC domain-containing protein n=1 Tax=Melia azedarach TaxID=155640 RepID=A0ACC1XDM3_MELAZ|nr:NAC domain-containing protein [Melia azedarach]
MASFFEGFGFCPDNSEIVSLLENKEANSTDDEGFKFILDIKFYNYEPQELSQLSTTNSGNEKMYYFTRLKFKHGGVINRQTPSGGSWIMTGCSKNIKDKYGNPSVNEKSFAYHKASGEKTQWLMKEYTLSNDQNKISGWALCVVYYKPSR